MGNEQGGHKEEATNFKVAPALGRGTSFNIRFDLFNYLFYCFITASRRSVAVSIRILYYIARIMVFNTAISSSLRTDLNLE
jgi:hypothetical protein